MQITLKLLITSVFIISLSSCQWVQKKSTSPQSKSPSLSLDLESLKNDSSIWIAHFENLTDSAIYIDTTWYFYDDAPALGQSKLQTYSFHQSLQKKSGNQYLSVKFQLKKAANDNYPYTGIGINLTDIDSLTRNKNIKGIIYDYKGYGHYLIIKQNNVLDYANYQSFLPSSSNWKRDTVLFNSLNQPNWGKKVDFDFSKTIGIDWFFTGSDQESGSLKIDNIRYLLQ